MNGIDKIKAKVMAEAESAAASVSAEASEKAAGIKADFDAQAQKAYDTALAAGKAEGDAAANRKVRTARLQAKNNILGVKQDMISKAFDKAKADIIGMPEEDYLEFLAEQACAAAISGEEAIVVNAADKARLGSKIADAANAKLSAAGKKAALALSDETANISGGLILKQGNVTVNCSVEALIELSRESLSVKVANVLFSE